MMAHLFFDLLAYALSISLSLLFFRPPRPFIEDKELRYSYYTYLIFGFVSGALLFGTLNNIYSLHSLVLGKSILGAIFGGTFAIEFFKLRHHIKGSTGAYFVPSLAIGIAIGRIGCFLTGLKDYTYGIETTHPFGYDFGDGLLRHPVQLYESALMTLLLLFSVVMFRKNRLFFKHYMFYLFILFYATERFFLEFLKPYERMIASLNLYQLLCLILIVYALYQLRSSHRLLRH